MSDMSRNHSSALFYRDWTVQKSGLQPEQNEDACLIRSFKPEDDSPLVLIAVADGATEAVYSRLWAKSLVEAAGPDWPELSDDGLGEQLKQVCKEFSPIEPGKDVQWFVRNKYMDQGSQATLLVVTLTGSTDDDSFDARAVAVGDCCLIVFKENGEVLSFPIHSSEQFGVNPVLLGNRIPRPTRYERWSAKVGCGDMILIATDAVSKWVLQCLESGKSELLFESLLELLDLSTSVDSQPVEVLSSAKSPLSPPLSRLEGNTFDRSKEISKPNPLLDLLGRLWPWSTHEQHDLTVSSAEPQLVPAVHTETTNSRDESLRSPAAQSAVEDVTSDLRPTFDEFIGRYRSPESELHMRNDDATMVICMPINNLAEAKYRDVVGVIRALEAAVAQRLPASQPMNEFTPD
jgi:protein phosphatase 2C-like protein